MKKSELLNWLREKYQQWEIFLDQIGPERMDQGGVNGDWSMKDIVAHLTGWNRWLVARLQAAQRSEPEQPPPWPAHLQTEDEINAGSMSPITGARCAKSWMKRIKYISSSSLSLKTYPMKSISMKSGTLERTTLCG